MPMQKPTFFAKVLQTLRQLSTTKGFSIKQISEHFQRWCVKRDFKEIKSIVQQALIYGLKNKLLQENCGKYHITAARLRSLHVKSSSEKKEKKHVRFKKIKSNISDSAKKSIRRKSRKASTNTRKSQKSNGIKRSKTSSRTQSKNSKRGPRDSGLMVEKQEIKKPLEVTPDRDVHDNCVNKKRNRVKESDVRAPPDLEPEPEIGIEPPRPSNKLIRKTPSRHSSRVRKELKHKYKHYCPHVVELERGKRLKDLIPDDKMYRKYKTRTRRSCDHVNSEESSDYDSRSSKDRYHRKCHHHSCHKGRHHQI